jgi:hypothetical protein
VGHADHGVVVAPHSAAGRVGPEISEFARLLPAAIWQRHCSSNLERARALTAVIRGAGEGAMKAWMAAIGIVFLATSSALAQQPAAPADQHHPAGAAQAPAPMPPASRSGPPMPMMDMCSQMMGGGMMSGSMPGMSGEQRQMDPRMMAGMMEMRGEMMKAMGDIMIKHAQKMQVPVR